MASPRSAPKTELTGARRRNEPKWTQPTGGETLKRCCSLRTQRFNGSGINIFRAETQRADNGVPLASRCLGPARIVVECLFRLVTSLTSAPILDYLFLPDHVIALG